MKYCQDKHKGRVVNTREKKYISRWKILYLDYRESRKKCLNIRQKLGTIAKN